MQNFPLILFFGSFWPTVFSQCQNCREFSLNLKTTTDKEGDVLLITLELNQTLKRFNLFLKNPQKTSSGYCLANKYYKQWISRQRISPKLIEMADFTFNLYHDLPETVQVFKPGRDFNYFIDN